MTDTASVSKTLHNAASFGPVQIGENGHLEYSWINVFQEKIVQLSFQLTRTKCPLQQKQLGVKYSELLNDSFYSPIIDQETRAKQIAMLYRLMLYTRDMIAGKGEYNLFYILLGEWVKLGNQRITIETDMINTLTNKALLSTVFLEDQHPYGCWKDMKYFLNYLYTIDGITGPKRQLPIFKEAIKCMVSQLKKDSTAETPSFLAKWIPREKSNKFGYLAKYIACEYYSEWFVERLNPSKKLDPHYDSKSKEGRKCLTHYRQLISRLNKKLGTVQIDQCNKTWGEINFEKSVTSRTLYKQGKAFEYIDHCGRYRSTNNDRIQCSENYKSYIHNCKKGTHKIKHARTEILELVRDADKYTKEKNSAFDTQKDMINLKWEASGDMVDNFEKSTLCDCIAMIDTSGSMRENDSDALYAAIALGCRIAEKSSLGKRILSFSNTPDWIDLSNEKTLTEMVERLRNDNTWGMNTNFEVALTKILDACIEKDLPAYDVENLTLVILSDMQIDFADKNSTTMHYAIEKLFSEGGMKTSHKKPYKPPRIVYWNLRSTNGFPTLSFMPNVSMVSGFSPVILNCFCKKGTAAMQYCTPWIMLNEQLNHERYMWANSIVQSEALKIGWSLPGEKDTVIIEDDTNNTNTTQKSWFSFW